MGPRLRLESGPAAAGPGSSGGFSVADIEVTQAIQNLAHSVELIAGKPTLVRVYLDRPDPAVITVHAEIEITGPHGTTSVPSVGTVDLDPARNGDLLTSRADLATSLNFVLPQHLNDAGSYTIRVKRVFTTDTGVELADAAPGAGRTVTFIDGAPLRVRVIMFRHRAGNSMQTYEPRVRDYELLASWLRRAYPAPEVIISRVTTDAATTWFNSLQYADRINAQISAMRNLDMNNGGDPLTHYLGMLSDGGGRTPVQGKASAIPGGADPTAVACAPAGSAYFTWDTDGSYGDWYGAHELAHTFGRSHIGQCDQGDDDPDYPFAQGAISGPGGEFVGVDTGDPALGQPMQAYSGSQYHDIMSYCPHVWLSPYTYTNIRKRINDEAASIAPPPPPAAAAPAPRSVESVREAGMGSPAPTQWLNIVGTVDLTDETGTIDFVQPLTGVDFPTGQSDDVTIRLLDARGTVIAEPKARVKLDTCINEGEHLGGVVDTFAAHDDRIATIELVIGRTVVATYPDTATFGNYRGLREDLTPTTTRYSVQVSPDEGASWQTVAVGLTDPHTYDVERSDFPDTPSLRRRVVETEGFNSRIISDEPI